MDYTVHGILQSMEWLPIPFSRVSSQPRDWTQISLTLQADSLPAGPPGKPNNTGVGSLSLLQGLSDPGIEPGSPSLQEDSLPAELPRKPREREREIIIYNWFVERSEPVRNTQEVAWSSSNPGLLSNEFFAIFLLCPLTTSQQASSLQHAQQFVCFFFMAVLGLHYCA